MVCVSVVTIYLYETRQDSVGGGCTERTYWKTIPFTRDMQRNTQTHLNESIEAALTLTYTHTQTLSNVS